jgi:hypothetical protein
MHRFPLSGPGLPGFFRFAGSPMPGKKRENCYQIVTAFAFVPVPPSSRITFTRQVPLKPPGMDGKPALNPCPCRKGI